MIFKAVSVTPEETAAIGKRLGSALKGDELVLLCGELGAGKTIFCKGVASALGIDPNEVVSPTFMLLNIYQGSFPLYHFDLYRIGEAARTADVGIDEYEGAGVLLIEWAQYLPDRYQHLKKTLVVEFQVTDEQRRAIVIRSRMKLPAF